MTLTQIKPAGLSTPIDLADNAKIRLGTGNDLQIYHSGTNSVIDNNTGDLVLRNNVASDVGGNIIIQAKSGEESAKFTHDGSVELRYDNVKKFETASHGVTFFGTGFHGDNIVSAFGNSSDLQIYHDGSDSIIHQDGTGDLRIRSDNSLEFNTAGQENAIWCDANAAVKLYYDNVKKAETTAHGFFVTGSLWADGLYLDDNEKIHLGTSGADLQIYHDGTNSLLKNSTGDLRMCSASVGFTNAANTEWILNGNENGAAQLYFDNSKKFETLSTGTRTSGNVQLPFADANNGLRNKISWTSQADYFDEVAYIAADRTALSGAVTDLVFATGSANAVSEAMRINSNGEVLVGTTSALNLGANNVTGVTIFPSGRVTAARNAAASAHFGRQQDTGEVVLFGCQGTAIVGSISVTTSATAFNTSHSDRTLKKNFENWTENTLELFKNINPQKFNFTQQEDTDPKHKGYIAQDLVSSFPEAYNKGDNDKYMFNPSGMVVYLMKAIQELEAEVAALKAA